MSGAEQRTYENEPSISGDLRSWITEKGKKIKY
jgi:hypothetical protein